ncbi:uncharacterized protein LOC111085590 [Limulus polyphemus]|uniref:Uncharacterized protein LOC111085590 n=1 Tax=Limulus polyphemus TaxID=6850 RepID=A0ABM1SAC2_LIMPO|nr:uncharacterized protein LOC111085590 [Limulus polyphemus]
MWAIIEIIQILAGKKSALRGNYISELGMEDGFFQTMFIFAISRDKKLEEIHRLIPRNAKYTSPEIHNQILGLLAKTIQQRSRNEVGDKKYAIKVDETRDKCNRENMCLCVRYLQDGNIVEHLLAVIPVSSFDAHSLTDSIIAILQEHSFSALPKPPATPCSCACDFVDAFFGTCNILYNFIRKPTVPVHYTGQVLKRLLEHRWTGHLATVKVITGSYKAILTILSDIATNENSTFLPELVAEAIGLLKLIKKKPFLFHAVAVHKALSILASVNIHLQSVSINLMQALMLISSSRASIALLRLDETFTTLLDEVKLILQNTAGDDNSVTVQDHQPAENRRRRENSGFKDYTVDHLYRDNTNLSENDNLKRSWFCLIDSILVELDERFSEKNSHLIRAMESLDPESEHFFDKDRMVFLADLIGLEMDSFVLAPTDVVKKYISDHWRKYDKHNLVSVLQQLFHLKSKRFPAITELYEAALTIGSSTATCKRVLTDLRQSMSHERLANLILIRFEKCILDDICQSIDGKYNILRDFNSIQNRRLKLL